MDVERTTVAQGPGVQTTQLVWRLLSILSLLGNTRLQWAMISLGKGGCVFRGTAPLSNYRETMERL